MRTRDTTEESENLLREVVNTVANYADHSRFELDFFDARINDAIYTGWTLTISFRHRPRYFTDHHNFRTEEVRDEQTYTISVAIDPMLPIRQGLADRLAEQLIPMLVEHMRDWNARNSAQRAEQRQRQQQEARDRTQQRSASDYALNPVEDTWPLPYRFNDTSNRVATTNFIRQAVDLVPPYYSTGANNTNTMQYIDPATIGNVYSSEEQIKTLLETLLTNGLDVKISMDESDGEVTAEVEVRFNGKVIASDSDSIQL